MTKMPIATREVQEFHALKKKKKNSLGEEQKLGALCVVRGKYFCKSEEVVG